MTKGGRNLVILGVVSAFVAVGTAGASLAIYHNTGDIYLDRSRPGFLPDEEEIEQDEVNKNDSDYKMEPTGTINAEILNEYLEKLKEEATALDAYETPFDASALGDERLDIKE